MEQNWFFEKKSMPGVVDVVVVEETLDELEIQRIRNAESEKSTFAAEQRDILFGTHVQVVYPCCMSPSFMKLFRRIQKL